MMNKQPRIPDAETSKRLLNNLRRARLELAEANLQLEEVSAMFEQEIREQKLNRVTQLLLQGKDIAFLGLMRYTA